MADGGKDRVGVGWGWLAGWKGILYLTHLEDSEFISAIFKPDCLFISGVCFFLWNSINSEGLESERERKLE